MEDPAEKINICIFDGLLSQEVVCHESDPVRKSWGELGGTCSYDLRKVLHNAANIAEGIYKTNADKTMGAANLAEFEISKMMRKAASLSVFETYVHDCSSANGFPRIVFDQMFEVVACSFCIRIHGVSEAFSPFRILRKLFIHAFLGTIRNSKSLFHHEF